MKITDVKASFYTLENMVIEQINRLSKKIPGQMEAWRHVFYMFGTDRYQSAIGTLIAYLSDIEIRKLNITYMQQYVEADNKVAYQLFYHNILVCTENTEVIRQYINIGIKDFIYPLIQSREILEEYLVSNNIIKRSEDDGRKRWNRERIAFCTFHKHCLTYRGILSQRCIYQQSKLCKYIIILQSPFWYTKYAKLLRK